MLSEQINASLLTKFSIFSAYSCAFKSASIIFELATRLITFFVTPTHRLLFSSSLIEYNLSNVLCPSVEFINGDIKSKYKSKA